MPIELYELFIIRVPGEWKPRVMFVLCCLSSIYIDSRFINYKNTFTNAEAFYVLICNLVFLGLMIYFLRKIIQTYLIKACSVLDGKFNEYYDINDDIQLCQLLILYQASLIIIENIGTLSERSFNDMFKEVHKLRRQEIKDLNKVVDEKIKYIDYKRNFLKRKSYIRSIYKDEDSVINGLVKTNRSLIL